MKISDWRKSLDIISKHSESGEDTDYIFAAEHDIIYSLLTIEDIPEDSEDGKILTELGWHIDGDDCWAQFV